MTLTIQSDGSTLTLADVEVTASFGVDQDAGAVTIRCGGSPPTLGDANTELLVYWGGDLLFNGLLSEPEYQLWPQQTTIVGQDYMARLSKPWANGYYEYIAQTAGDVETNLIEKSAINPALHVVVDSGRVIGSAGNPLRLRDGTPAAYSGDPQGGAADVPLQIMRSLLELDLYYVTSRSNGAIYIDAIATGSPVVSYSTGFGLRNLRVRKGRPSEIRNKYLVKGLEILGIGYQAEYSATSPYLASPFQYQAGPGITNPMLESDADCLAVATAYVTFYNRLIPVVDFEVDGDVRIQPGVTLAFDASQAGLSGATNVFVQRVTHTVTSSGDYKITGTAIAI